MGGGREMTVIRYVKIFLVLAVGYWGLVGTVGNLSHLSEVYNEVQSVTSMSGVPEGVGPPWRTSNAVVVSIGVAAVLFGKIAAVIGGYGGISMWRNVNATASDFNRSKKWAIAGCALAFGLVMFSFTFAAEGTFFMFYDPSKQVAGELAFRFAGSFALVAIVVAQED